MKESLVGLALRGGRLCSTVAMVSVLVLCGCGRKGDDSLPQGGSNDAAGAPSGSASATGGSASGEVVDSVFPMDVMLSRFREGTTQPAGLEHGEASRDALVARFVQALERSDTLA